MKETNAKQYTWKDILDIRGYIVAEEFPISGEMDNEGCYCIDEFMEEVSKKYNIPLSEIKTYRMDNIIFDPAGLPFGAESCGCYINGVPEWLLD